MNKEFTGDDDTMTVAGAMKGLSIYLMEEMTDEEIVEANAFASALEEAKMALVSEIRQTLKTMKMRNCISQRLCKCIGRGKNGNGIRNPTDSKDNEDARQEF